MKKLRSLGILILAVALVTLIATSAYADPATAGRYLKTSSWRGPGYYLSWIKILVEWLLFLCWIRTADWANRDMLEYNLEFLRWNPIIVGSFMGTMVVTWISPWFWLNLALLVVAYVAPVTAYILYRNKNVEEHQMIFTREHLRFWFANVLGKIGIKISATPPDPNAGGAPVKLNARGGGEPAIDNARVLAARQSGALPLTRQVIADGLGARASAIVLDYLQTSVAVRFMIDGVWHPQENLEREAADPVAVALKELCGLNPQDRRARQEGKFLVEYFVIRRKEVDKMEKAEARYREAQTVELTRKMASEELQPPQLQVEVAAAVEELAREKFATAIGVWTPVDKEKLPQLPGMEPLNPLTTLEMIKCPGTFASQGTPTGERLLIQFELKATNLITLDDIGMRTKMQEQVKAFFARPRGFVLFAAPPGAGLRTTTKVVLGSVDRFTRDCISVESVNNRYDEVENVAPETYTPEDDLSETILPRIFRKQPHLVVVRDLINSQVTATLCRESLTQERVILSTIRAKDAVEALVRVLAIDKAPPPEFAQAITAVLCSRLIRTLCEKCKQAYAPPPQILQQMGIPPGKVRSFFRPPPPTPADEKKSVCRGCGGIGYKGQTALFELLVVDDGVRAALSAAPRKMEALRLAARKAGMKSFQEEGVLMVARGVTSVPELMRVLKG